MRDSRIKAIQAAFAKGEKKPRWYVNGEGQTMVVIPGPIEGVHYQGMKVAYSKDHEELMVVTNRTG